MNFIHQIHFYITQEISAKKAILIASLFAILFLWFIFPFNFWVGNSGFFEKIDASQHIAGWQFYAQDSWRFPLLQTTRVNAPDGINVAFMDSIPLAAVLFKMVIDFLPSHFHYIGIWHILVFMTQAVAASLLIRSLGAKSLLACICAGFFSCFWPALLWRFGHTALMTQSLLLIGLTVYFSYKNMTLTLSQTHRYLIACCIGGLLIHPYFIAMLYPLYLLILVDAGIHYKNWRQSFLYFITSILLLVACYFIFGYQGQNTTSFGFGEYSMNLLSPFCGGKFISCVDSVTAHQFAQYNFPDATTGQYEGMNYLGLGILFLIPIALFVEKENIVKGINKHYLLFLLLTSFTVYSFSNLIYWNDTLLLSYKVPSFIEKVTNTFRSSGRFFWLVSYVILFLSLAALLKDKVGLQYKRVAMWKMGIIFVLMPLQFFDVQQYSQRVSNIAEEPSKNDLAPWENVMLTVDKIRLYPAFGCHHNDVNVYWFFQRAGAYYQKLMDSAYIARANVDCTKNRQTFENEFEKNQLYVMSKKDIFAAPKGFINALSRQQCVDWNDMIVCQTNSNLSHHNGPSLQFKPSYYSQTMTWQGAQLPTQVGKIDLVSQSIISNQNAGVLSYGPYVKLPIGQYSFELSYSSSLASNIIVGTWDMVVNIKDEKPVMIGNLMGTKNQKSVVNGVFSINQQHADQLLEIRSFFLGAGEMTIHSMKLQKN